MLKLAFRNLWTNKSRTLLAMSGLIIGVMTIVTLISLTQGVTASVLGIFDSMKGIYVLEKDSVDQSLSTISIDWIDRLEQVGGVKAAVPEVWAFPTEIEGESDFGGLSSFGQIYVVGVDPVRERFRVGGFYGSDVEKGRYFKPSDKNSAVLGDQVAEGLKKTVGSSIKIGDHTFRVIGILEPSTFVGSVIAVPLEPAQDIGGFESDEISDVLVSLNNPDEEKKVSEFIKFKYGEDVDAFSMNEYGGTVEELTSTIDLFFYVISAIAIVIGGVGIINTMLMSVMERVRDFGVLRAMGWTKDNIIRLILTESFFLGIGGAVIGITFSFLLVGIVASYLPFPIPIQPSLLGYVSIFSVVLALGAGVYPAWKASRLDPVEAMRGE